MMMGPVEGEVEVEVGVALVVAMGVNTQRLPTGVWLHPLPLPRPRDHPLPASGPVEAWECRGRQALEVMVPGVGAGMVLGVVARQGACPSGHGPVKGHL